MPGHARKDIVREGEVATSPSRTIGNKAAGALEFHVTPG